MANLDEVLEALLADRDEAFRAVSMTRGTYEAAVSEYLHSAQAWEATSRSGSNFRLEWLWQRRRAADDEYEAAHLEYVEARAMEAYLTTAVLAAAAARPDSSRARSSKRNSAIGPKDMRPYGKRRLPRTRSIAA